MIRGSVRRSLKLAVSALATGIVACSGAFIVTTYPLNEVGSARDAPDDTGDAGASEGPAMSSPRYWSAYVRLEHRDIPRLWSVTRQDYVLITAKATIPTRQGKLVRDFPLFVVDEGQVQALQGVDLLQRFPLSADGREQVLVHVEVKILEDRETLKTVRAVLDEAQKGSEPYLGNYAVATGIVSNAVAIIDRLVDVDTKRPSSTTVAVDIGRLENGGKAQRLQAFLIFPFGVGESSDRPNPDAFSGELYECSGAPGMLCTKEAGRYQTDRFRDVAYVTIEFVAYERVFDPAVFVRGAKANCSQVTAESVALAKEYLAQNEGLFSIQDVDDARAEHGLAEAYLRLREAMRAKDIDGMVELLETEESWGAFSSHERYPYGAALKECWDAAWDQSPAVEVWQAWSLYRSQQRCGLASDLALRADLIHHALARMAQMTGRPFSATETKVWGGQANPIASLLQAELAWTWTTLHGEDPAKTFAAKKWCAEPDATARNVCVHCEECWRALEATCPGEFVQMNANRGRRLALLEAMIEHVRCNDDGSLWGCEECGAPRFEDEPEEGSAQPGRSCDVLASCGVR